MSLESKVLSQIVIAGRTLFVRSTTRLLRRWLPHWPLALLAMTAGGSLESIFDCGEDFVCSLHNEVASSLATTLAVGAPYNDVIISP